MACLRVKQNSCFDDADAYHLCCFPFHGASLCLQMLTSLASPEGYVQSTSESPAPTPPPKDYPDSLIKFSANNHGTYRTTTPNGLGHIDASEDSYFALGHNRRPSGPYLSPRPALRLGSSFARPAPPTLTITPISAPVPSFVRGRASERSSTVAAHAALKAASTASNRSAKALPQRPSLPNFKKSDYESMASDSESEVSDGSMMQLVF